MFGKIQSIAKEQEMSATNILTLLAAILMILSMQACSPADTVKPEHVKDGSRGLHGYVGYTTPPRPTDFGAGIGFYTAVWPLIEYPVAGFQIGLPGNWIQPDNGDNKDIPLCPDGTIARTWEPRGPTWSSVFQTIEGGLGYWRGNKFNYGSPKFSMNAVPNCYNSEIASPGWPFFYRNMALPDGELGIAQLSNRILIPPDGITFMGSLDDCFLGYTHMALPLSEPREKPQPTGNQNWTLFLNASNFKGPVAYYIPEMWSRLSKDYEAIRGRGLDTRPGTMGGGGAMEINTVPSFKVKDADSTLYVKIPQLRFPLDENGRSILVQDVKYYSKDALYNCLDAWKAGGKPCSGTFDQRAAWTPPLITRNVRLDQEGKMIAGIDSIFEPTIFPSNAFGLQWKESAVTREGMFPQYFRLEGENHIPVQASEVPEALRSKEFPKASTETDFKNWRFGNETIEGNFRYAKTDPYTSPDTGAWGNPGPAAGPFTATLEDGSKVTYHWYRFIDQPSFQQYGWSEKERRELQSFVEKIHQHWTIDKEYMEPPTTGKLVAIDKSLIVAPPAGMEVGYVPIVTRQE
ncbi:MAG: hypothetical protein WD824_24085 [Cyclobacteriaceae bacterium]